MVNNSHTLNQRDILVCIGALLAVGQARRPVSYDLVNIYQLFMCLAHTRQLRYERFKNIHPYLGFESVDYHGDTADYRQRMGEGLDQTVAVIGIAAWF